MSIALITGSAGLIGSEASRFFHDRGLDILGLDNNMRQYFFGEDGSTTWNREALERDLGNYRHFDVDIRDPEAIEALFSEWGKNIELVIHAAAQPSHDWAAREPVTDFTINANGTLILLEGTRRFCPDAAFIFTSTNKVYGDAPNELPLVECGLRWEIEQTHPYYQFGIDEGLRIDQCKHSLFGASKIAADILVQEYGRYFGLKTAVFRGGCLTGPAHSAAELHGFLGYLVKCVVAGRSYTVFGYKGKQVRDNIHSQDLVSAFWQYFQNPREGEVYNMGGGRRANVSLLEAIETTEQFAGRKLDYTVSEEARNGDHIWWISDVRKFQEHYPGWKCEYDIKRTLREMVAVAQERER